MRRRIILARLPERPPRAPDQPGRRIGAEVGDKLTEGTLFQAQPYKEAASATAAELSDYRWIAGFLIFLLLFSAFVLIVYSEDLRLSLFLGGLFLVLLLPLTMTLITMRKSYLAIGFVAVGAWVTLAGAIILANLVAPWAPVPETLDASVWDAALFAIGIPAIVTGIRMWMRREPFYGFR